MIHNTHQNTICLYTQLLLLNMHPWFSLYLLQFNYSFPALLNKAIFIPCRGFNLCWHHLCFNIDERPFGKSTDKNMHIAWHIIIKQTYWSGLFYFERIAAIHFMLCPSDYNEVSSHYFSIYHVPQDKG